MPLGHKCKVQNNVCVSKAGRRGRTRYYKVTYVIPGAPSVAVAPVLHLVLVMRIAIPTWRGRVSPVFDAARNLLLVDAQDGREIRREETTVEPADLVARAKRVAQLGTDLLICGAISWPLEATLVSTGVGVISQTCGPVEEVLRAFLSGQLTQQAFLMPGCRGRRRRLRGRRRRGRPWA